MAIRRGSVPTDNFTIISNEWLRDARLSWKAKGLLAYIISHRAGYALSVEQIIAEGEDGRDAVRAGLRELEETGYLTREQRRGEGGKIVATDYLIGKPVVGEPVSGCDQGEEDVSAGQTSDGISGGGKPASKKTTSEKTTEDQPSTRARTPRGTRVPDPFIPDESLRSWYRENIGDRIDGLAEHERFMDYWRAQPGQKGVKTDWPATWRNWMRRAAERPQRGRAVAQSGYQSAAERSNAALDREAEVARVAEAIVESRGGNPESFTEVSPVMARLKAEPALLDLLLPVLALPVPEQAAFLERTLQALHQQNGSAPRTSGLYSEGDGYIDGQVREHREVTSHASE